MFPIWQQYGPKMAQDSPKVAPSGPQVGSKMAPRRLQVSQEHRHLYVEADHAAYVEATEFAEVLVDIADEPRAQAIRSIRPSVPD